MAVAIAFLLWLLGEVVPARQEPLWQPKKPHSSHGGSLPSVTVKALLLRLCGNSLYGAYPNATTSLTLSLDQPSMQELDTCTSLAPTPLTSWWFLLRQANSSAN